MSKNKNGVIVSLVSIIVILAIVSIVSIIYNFNGGFYFSRVVQFDKVLGQEQTILIKGEGAYVTGCNFAGTRLLNDDIKQQINIKTESIYEPLYLRAKVELAGSKMQKNMIFGFTNWVQSDDGYIYFNQTISSNEQIGMCKYVRLSDENKFESNLNYMLIFVVEASKLPYSY